MSTSTKQTVRKKEKYINADQPAVIKHSNDCMGCIDLVDRALSDLRPVYAGVKNDTGQRDKPNVFFYMG